MSETPTEPAERSRARRNQSVIFGIVAVGVLIMFVGLLGARVSETPALRSEPKLVGRWGAETGGKDSVAFQLAFEADGTGTIYPSADSPAGFSWSFEGGAITFTETPGLSGRSREFGSWLRENGMASLNNSAMYVQVISEDELRLHVAGQGWLAKTWFLRRWPRDAAFPFRYRR